MFHLALTPSIFACILLLVLVNSGFAEDVSSAPDYDHAAFAVRHAEWVRQQFQQQLEEQQSAHKRDKEVTMMMTLYPTPTEPIAGGFVVKANGTLTEFKKNSRFYEDYGETVMPPTALRKLHTLLSQLPPTTSPNSVRCVVISFLAHKKWTTRLYDGKKGHDVLQDIIALPSKYKLGGLVPSDYVLPR